MRDHKHALLASQSIFVFPSRTMKQNEILHARDGVMYNGIMKTFDNTIPEGRNLMICGHICNVYMSCAGRNRHIRKIWRNGIPWITGNVPSATYTVTRSGCTRAFWWTYSWPQLMMLFTVTSFRVPEGSQVHLDLPDWRVTGWVSVLTAV